MKTALLVIDVQRELSEGRFAAFDADRVIERINAMARRARAAGAPVIFVQHETPDGALRHGAEGWQLARGLEALPGDHHVYKKSSDAFHQTMLETLLRGLGVGQLVVCGMQSEFCVDSTTRRALALGFPTTLVSDGHATLDNSVLSAAQIAEHHNVTLANIDSYAVRMSLATAADVRFAA